MSSTRANKDYWKSYSLALKNLVLEGATLGPNQAFFVAPQNLRGILAGQRIPPEVTNYGIYQYGNGLLQSDSPIYAGSADQYILALKNYLNYVEPGENKQPGNLEILNDAIKNVTTWTEIFTKSRSEAQKLWSEDLTKPTDQGFFAWVTNNYPKYLATQKNLSAASGAAAAARSKYYGPAAAPLNDAIQRIELLTGLGATEYQPGFNMRVTAERVEISKDDALKAASGLEVGLPTFSSFLVPEFTIQGGIENLAKEWSIAFAKGNLEPIPLKIDLGNGNKDWNDLGIDKRTSGDLGYKTGWLNVSADYSNQAGWNNFSNSLDANEVSINLEIYGFRQFDIHTGSWDIPNIGEAYPHVRKDAPQSLFKLVQPKKLAFTYATGLTAVFSNKVRNEFSKHYKSIEKAGATLNILGFNVGGSTSTGEETTTKGATWDEASGTLRIPPEDTGYLTLLAVIGQRVSAPGA